MSGRLAMRSPIRLARHRSPTTPATRNSSRVRLEQVDHRDIDLERLGGDRGHAGRAAPAGRARRPRAGRAGPDARCSARAAAPAHARVGADVADRRDDSGCPWSCSGLSAISTTTSLPSLRLATSSVCVPIGRGRGRGRRPRGSRRGAGGSRRARARRPQADQLVDRVAEQRGGRGIGEHDRAGAVGDEQRVGIGERRAMRNDACRSATRRRAIGRGQSAARQPVVTGATRM